LLDAAGARNMAKYLRAGWRSEEEIDGRSGCPISGQWHGKLSGVNTIRSPGWMCVDYVRTGRSERDIVMRVMFDTIREQTIILHSVAVKLGLRASGGPAWLTHRGAGRGPEVQQLQVHSTNPGWKGRGEWIEARGVSYTTRRSGGMLQRVPERRSQRLPGRT
jgi:hypothetical protein